MIKIDMEICRELFESDFSSLSRKKLKELDDISTCVLKDNSWDEVYRYFNNYLRNECKTEDDVINYMCFFNYYVGLRFYIPSEYDPYDLIGYILSMVNLEKRWDDCGSLFDDFANTALRIDLVKDPYYQFWRDPKIIEIAEKYKEKRNGLH